MTTPAQDRDIRATLSRPQRTEAELEAAAWRLLSDSEFLGDTYYGDEWRVVDMRDTGAEGWWWLARTGPMPRASSTCDHPTADAAAVDLLRHHPELWPKEREEPAPSPAPDPLREALRLLKRAGHEPTSAENPAEEPYCCICDEDYPCDVEQARRRLAAALGTPDPLEGR